jgi:hypothetical protein
MTRRKDDPTAVAQEIIDLIGGDTGLSRLRAARVEALSDGVIFNLMTDSMTTEGIVVIRKVGAHTFRVYVAQLTKWIEARSSDGVRPEHVKLVLWRLIGKKEPTF